MVPYEPHRVDLMGNARPGGAWGSLPVLRRAFWTGVLIATPVLVTLWLTASIVLWVDGLVMPLLPASARPETYLGVSLPGFGLLAALFALTLLGLLAANVLGLKVIDSAERLVARLPLVRAVYKTTQEVMGTLLTRGEASFHEVALIEFPRPGAWAIVFVTSNAKGAADALFKEDMVSVFLPTTPNPTTGFFLYLPRREVRFLDISVEEAMKLVISAGLVGPDRVTGSTPQGARTLISNLRRSFDGARLFTRKGGGEGRSPGP